MKAIPFIWSCICGEDVDDYLTEEGPTLELLCPHCDRWTDIHNLNDRDYLRYLAAKELLAIGDNMP